MPEQEYYVYILTNKWHTTLYTGSTNDLRRRVHEHREKVVEGFTKRYNLTKLVYYEAGGDLEGARLREKQVKQYSRRKKVELINRMNEAWRDLYEEL